MVEVLGNLHDVRKGPPTFCELQHFALDFRERDVLALCFRDNFGDKELFGFPSAVESLHVANFTPVPCGGADNCRNTPLRS